jgi:hypothetical protein
MAVVWLNQLAWVALAAVTVPIAIHLLAHRRAERVVFPTLRFIQPTRLAAVHRRVLEDLPLLVVRAAIVAAAAAAFAGPLLITAGRRAAWNGRLVRAIVAVPGRSGTAASAELAFRTERFEANEIGDGIRRAVAWLDSAPPARRELVVAGPLTLGSITAADIAAVPPHVGVGFERSSAPPAVRTIGEAVVTRTAVAHRTVTLEGRETTVRDESSGPAVPPPIDIIAPGDLQRTADAALAAVLSTGVARPPAERRARLELFTDVVRDAANATPIRVAWMADAVAAIARDPDLIAEAAAVAQGAADERLARSPWIPVARAADGRALAAAAATDDRLLVAAAVRSGDLVAPVLAHAVAASLGPRSDTRDVEVLPIPDEHLRAWTRAPGTPPAPKPDTVERDDRRWMWIAVVGLLGLETWMRRARRDAEAVPHMERARVA